MSGTVAGNAGDARDAGAEGGFVIRRATVADAALVSRLAARTFTETFGHLYPAQDLAHFIEDSYAPERQAMILAQPGYAIWLVEQGDDLVGHAAAGPCGLPHPDVRPGDGELKRLYLLARVQGTGLGTRLFDTALAWLQRERLRTLWIGVWSGNAGAQRFYARHGFARVGQYDFPVGRTIDLEYILHRDAHWKPGA